jgi:hypothetical protein
MPDAKQPAIPPAARTLEPAIWATCVAAVKTEGRDRGANGAAVARTARLLVRAAPGRSPTDSAVAREASTPIGGWALLAARARPDAAPRRSSAIQHDAHKTDVRAVVYPWHPLHGQAVEVVCRGAFGMLRCLVGASTSDRLVSIPAWMLDPVTCAGMRAGAEPHVSISALEELRCLLDESRALDTEPKSRAVTVHEEEAETKTRRSTASATTRLVASVEGSSGSVAQGGHSTAWRGPPATRPPSRCKAKGRSS